jgi:DNA-binding winged helix-turn-helix (wHTH) protein/TolB-like protein/Tfp pilus assembly protein PilF
MPHKHFEFGPYHLDPTDHLLTRGEELIQLPPKAFETLVLLVENSGHILQKSALMGALWPDSFVEEANLTQNIFLVRKALGEESGVQYVKTIPRVGYRFMMPVREVFDETDTVIVETHSRERIVIREQIVEHIEETDTGPTIASAITRLTSSLPRGQIALASSLVVIVAVTLAAFLLYRANSQKTIRNERIANIHSLAVVPFETLDLESSDHLLGLGMSEALTNRLGHFNLISVRPAGAVEKYTNGQNDPVVIGRELSADAVLSGRVQKTGSRIRVSAQLVSAHDNAVLWSEVFEDNYANIFTLQDQVAEQLAGEIANARGQHPRTLLASRRAQNTDAYEAYLKGLYYWNRRTPEGGQKAAEYFKKSIEIDPSFALGYAGLADVHMLFAAQASQILNTVPPFEALVAKAIELDSSLAEPHAALAYHKSAVEWDWLGAEKEFERAIALNPSYVTARHWHAYNLISMGRGDEAVAEIERARQIDPVSLIINTDVGHINYLARKYDQAVKVLEETVAMDPYFAIARERLGEVYAAQGKYEEAIAQLQRSIALNNGPSGEIEARLGYVYAASGKKDLARQQLKAMDCRGGRTCDQASVALILTGLRQKEPALAALAQAVTHRAGLMTFYKVDPMFDNLRSDPRNDDLLGRMALPATGG